MFRHVCHGFNVVRGGVKINLVLVEKGGLPGWKILRDRGTNNRDAKAVDKRVLLDVDEGDIESCPCGGEVHVTVGHQFIMRGMITKMLRNAAEFLVAQVFFDGMRWDGQTPTGAVGNGTATEWGGSDVDGLAEATWLVLIFLRCVGFMLGEVLNDTPNHATIDM